MKRNIEEDEEDYLFLDDIGLDLNEKLKIIFEKFDFGKEDEEDMMANKSPPSTPSKTNKKKKRIKSISPESSKSERSEEEEENEDEEEEVKIERNHPPIPIPGVKLIDEEKNNLIKSFKRPRKFIKFNGKKKKKKTVF